MPWARLKKPIDLGTVKFVPADAFLSAGTFNQDEQDQLSAYFGSFQERGQVVSPITVCTVNDKTGEFTEAEWELLVGAISALVFATVCPVTVAAVKTNNRTRVPASSDRYLLHRAYLSPDGVIQSKGDITNFEPYASLIEHKPRYIIDGLSAPLESTIEDLGYLFARQSDPAANRILRALFFFARAQTNNPEVTEFAKLIYLGTAFEILFQCQGQREKRIHVMNEMETLWSVNLTTELITYNNQSRQRVSPAAWYQAFYMVRNAYVHGDPVSAQQLSYPLNGRDWLAHRIISSVVFWASVMEMIVRMKCEDQAEPLDDGEKLGLRGAHNWGLRDAFGGLGWLQAAPAAATP